MWLLLFPPTHNQGVHFHQSDAARRIIGINTFTTIGRRLLFRILPPRPLSPTELVPPITLHTDRPYISSSTWAQAAPACSGVVSPYTVMDLSALCHWGPRGWPCPAGVGGDPPSFPQCMHVPGAAAAACAAWGRSESTSPATQSPRFIAAATSPYVLPSIPSLTCRPAHLSDDAALACRVARLHPRPHIHVRGAGEERLLFPICDSAPRDTGDPSKSALGAGRRVIHIP